MSGTKGQNGDILFEWRSRLQRGDTSWLDEFYLSNKQPFEAWCEKNYDLNSEELNDVYHNAVINMYENIFYNRIEKLKSAPRTYLFGIAKNLILKNYRQHRIAGKHEDRLQEHWNFLTELNEPLDDLYKYVKGALADTTSPCKEIIELFYIQGYALSAISEELGYESPEVVKTQKSRCLNALRQKVFNLQEQETS